MSEDENKIKAKNKRGFFRNVLKSIKDFDKYEDAVNARKEAEIKYGFTCDDIVASYDNTS